MYTLYYFQFPMANFIPVIMTYMNEESSTVKRPFNCLKQRSNAQSFSPENIQIPKTGSISGHFIGQWTSTHE